MKGNKGFIFKSVLVLLLLAVVFVMVGYIIVTQSTVSITASMTETVAFNAKSAATTVDATFNENFLELGKAVDPAYEYNKERFSARGTLDGQNISLDFPNGENYSWTISQQGFYQELWSRDFAVYSLKQLTTGVSGVAIPTEIADRTYFIYLKKQNPNDVANRFDLLIQTQAQFGAQLAAMKQGGSTFKGFGLTIEDRVVFAGDAELFSFGQTLDGLIAEKIANTPVNAVAFETSIGDTKYVVGLYRLDTVSDGLARCYFLGVTDISEIQSVVGKFTTDLIMIIGFSYLLTLVVILIYGFFVKPSRKAVLSKKGGFATDAKEAFVVAVDSEGEITKSSPDYDRHYSVRKLAQNVVYKAFHDSMEVGDDFLCVMKDHKGDRHLLELRVARTLGKGKKKTGYELVGSDISDLAEMMAGAMNVELKTEEDDTMRKTYEKLIFSYKRILVGRIHITNLTNLQVMFGKEFSDKVFQTVVQKAAKRFESVFPNRGDDSVGVIVAQAQDFSARSDELAADMTEMNKPVNVDDNLVSVGCEGGFDLVERGVGDTGFSYVDRCIRAAMKRAAADDHKEYYVYHDFQKKQYLKFMEKEYDIKKMLEENSFEMQFQPQFSVKENRVAGFEALFRFRKTLNIDIDTFSFIQYAERTGNMILLGNFIFENSMRFAKSLEGKNVTVSLNVSPVQLMQVGFTENLLRIYRQFELKPGSVCIEITESFLMTMMDETLKKLDILIAAGIQVHLDDFGTRFSSMLYLKKLPISAIKIDMEFVRDLCNDDYSRNITQMIINIARQLGVESIAEGVETEAQKKMLAEMGCDHLQGFLIGKSMPEKEAYGLL